MPDGRGEWMLQGSKAVDGVVSGNSDSQGSENSVDMGGMGASRCSVECWPWTEQGATTQRPAVYFANCRSTVPMRHRCLDLLRSPWHRGMLPCWTARILISIIRKWLQSGNRLDLMRTSRLGWVSLHEGRRVPETMPSNGFSSPQSTWGQTKSPLPVEVTLCSTVVGQCWSAIAESRLTRPRIPQMCHLNTLPRRLQRNLLGQLLKSA